MTTDPMTSIRELDAKCSRLIDEAWGKARGLVEPHTPLVLLDPPQPFDLLYGGERAGGMASFQKPKSVVDRYLEWNSAPAWVRR